VDRDKADSAVEAGERHGLMRGQMTAAAAVDAADDVDEDR
jgi:hypothetical protein